MFHLYITLAYIILILYPFFRIKDLFISDGYKRWYVLIYLLLAAIYPLAGSFWSQERNILMIALSNGSGYMLPFYLYLLLAVLIYDLFLAFNLLVRILSPDTRKKFSFRIYMLSVMVFTSVAVVTAGAINLNTIRVSEYRIEIPRKQAKQDHLRIAFVADMHIMTNTSLRFVKQLIRKVNALNPDLLLYGGDIIEGKSESEVITTIESMLSTISTKYGSFGIPGNHEYYLGKIRGDFYQKAGITLLCDTVVKIDSSFYLAGRFDQQYQRRKSMTTILESITSDLPVILMDHRPTQLQEVSRTAVDLQFSGHTHNGQLFPLNFIIHQLYELSWGYKKIRNTHFFVTSGLRLWGPPVKTAGKSEIMLVDISFK
jgi:predicted MPP superfamily phosphohydrolase